MTLTKFRSGGTGESICFAIGECSLGSILVAATEQGVCAILLGDDPIAIEVGLFTFALLRGSMNMGSERNISFTGSVKVEEMKLSSLV